MKLCFITSSRADYGLIKPLIDEAIGRADVEFQLIVTGTHLDKKHGYTIAEIKEDGVKISAKIPISQEDSSQSIIKSMANELFGLADALQKLQPDLMIIPGDRYEMLAAASACLIARIPVAHIYGGDITEGAFDDAIRHAITKLSHLHFASNESSQRRMIQMGEAPENVFNTGSPSLDKIKLLKLLSRAELEKDLKIKFRKFNLLVTYHPETLGDSSITELTDSLAQLDDAHTIIITMPNADPGNAEIRQSWKSFAKNKTNVYLFESLGYLRYLSLMSHSTMVIGNSSSGLYEAPSFKIPTVNIGTRQKGRVLAESVISIICKSKEISIAIEQAKNLDCKNVKNPYGEGDSAKKIIDKIISIKPSIIKKFHDIHNR